MSVTKFATTPATTSATLEAEWVKLFPRQVTETYTSSATFMKQLTVVALSTITYLKNVFPEESYTNETFGGILIKVLKKNCRDELAQFVSTSLTNAFEAFNKKYLHRLALCLYDGECHEENLMEYYLFEFTYNKEGGVTMSVQSKGSDSPKQSVRFAFENIRQQTVNLVRACVVVAQSSDFSLPPSYDISLRLYYNDDAPDGYQPPGFITPPELQDQLAATAAQAFKVGAVETPFHRLVARSYVKEEVPSSREVNVSDNLPLMTQNEDGDFCHSRPEPEPEPERARPRCPCNRPCNDGEPTLTCHYCGTMQHAACFGIVGSAASSVSRHCCLSCAAADPTRRPTCPTLARTSSEKIVPLCIFRRTLEWCSLAQSVGLRELVDKFQISQSKAAKLLELIESYGVVKKASKSDIMNPRKIYPERVNVAKKRFFHTMESTVVDGLISETLSQGSQPDPVSAVLGPLEQVSLQNETTLGKIVEHTRPNVAADDCTLKEYREALLSSNRNMDAELPLSGSHNPVKDMANIGKRTTKRKKDEENRPLRVGLRNKRARAMSNHV